MAVKLAGQISRNTIQHEWAGEYAQGQVTWNRHKPGMTQELLDAYAEGIRQGWSRAVVVLRDNGLLNMAKISE